MCDRIGCFLCCCFWLITVASAVASSAAGTLAEAKALAHEKRYSEAVEKLEQARVTFPDEHEIPNFLGVLHIEMGQYAEAEQVLSELLQEAPELTGAHFNYGELYFRQSKYEESRKHFVQSLELKETDNTGLGQYKISLCDLMLGSLQDSGVAGANADHPQAYYLQVAQYFQSGQDETAQEWLKSAYKIYPLRKNVVYLDSLVTLGWVPKEEFDRLMAALRRKMLRRNFSMKGTQSLESTVQDEMEKESDAARKMSELESALPKLEKSEK